MSILAVQAQRLAEDGLSPGEIEAQLIREGNPPETVKATVASLGRWVQQTKAAQSKATNLNEGGASRSGGGADIAIGVFFLLLGIGGSFAGPKIFIGAIVVGVARLIRGFGRLG
jgi:hypothetical protein